MRYMTQIDDMWKIITSEREELIKEIKKLKKKNKKLMKIIYNNGKNNEKQWLE